MLYLDKHKINKNRCSASLKNYLTLDGDINQKCKEIITNNLKSDEEIKMCSMIYTFSKPIYFRNNKFCLILYQENHSVKEAFIHFNIYKVSDRHIPI